MSHLQYDNLFITCFLKTFDMSKPFITNLCL